MFKKNKEPKLLSKIISGKFDETKEISIPHGLKMEDIRGVAIAMHAWPCPTAIDSHRVGKKSLTIFVRADSISEVHAVIFYMGVE